MKATGAAEEAHDVPQGWGHRRHRPARRNSDCREMWISAAAPAVAPTAAPILNGSGRTLARIGGGVAVMNASAMARQGDCREHRRVYARRRVE